MPPRTPRRSETFDHRDWLALIDVSGPFLSVPVLKRHWPVLDALDKPTREQLRRAHAGLPGRDWIDYVLRDLLEWDDALVTDDLDDLILEVAQHDTTVAADFALVEPGADVKPETVRLLGLVCDGPPTQRITGEVWAATPVDRLAHLCRRHKVQLGLVTDGRWWALVWAPVGGATTTAVFEAVNWHEAADRDMVRAFVSILRRSRFFAVPDGETLPALLEDSKDSQEDLTEALGVQVRQAVELLVMAIGRANARERQAGGQGFLLAEDASGNLTGVTAHEVYRGAVAVMMRIVFLLFAEERGLLPADKELYRTSYSVGLLGAELERRAREGSETDLEHSTSAWHRLLATFNAVYYGVDHPELRMHPHDGSIFDPQAFEWLPHTIDDRTVLHMLQAVQHVQVGTGKNRERRRLSFNQLDVEQIGYVYEGLLSYDGFYADETVVGLVGKEGFEAEVPLDHLIELHAAAGSVEAFAAKLAADYKDTRIGSASALAKKLAPLSAAEQEEAKKRLLEVTGNNYALMLRILPLFGIIRRDLRDQPLVILTDALYVTESALRKNTGTHYTPRFLAEQVVEGALEPLVYDTGPLQTADRDQWQPVGAERILSLKVADIAMGSAAFLVAACRYLAGHLVEAWSREGDSRARAYLAKPKENALADDVDPIVIAARRQIIEHCLYGVDINEMAVEMAKLSLWLISMDPQRPFTFLDDRLICGDSLLGITSIDQLEVMHMNAKRGRRIHERLDPRLTAGVRELIAQVATKRRELVEIDGSTLERLEEKREILDETLAQTERARFIADLTVGAALAYAKRGEGGVRDASIRVADFAMRILDGDERAESQARDQLHRWLATDLPLGGFARNTLQWPLMFPEVFEAGGFDAIIGNPPFLGGKKISGASGISYREYLVHAVASDTKGNADLIAYFELRAHELINHNGQTGLIGTNTLGQGDTREVGLDQITDSGIMIREAIKSRPWPSKSAALEYCAVWTSRQAISGEIKRLLDGIETAGITSSLDPESRVKGPAYRLVQNAGISFIGNLVNGIGFIVTDEDVAILKNQDTRSVEVLYRYLNGEDLNSSPALSASRWVIDFGGASLEEANIYSACLDRVRRLVKPARDRMPDSKRATREAWWRFEKLAPGLRRAISGLERVIVITRMSKAVMPALVPTGQVFSDSLVVFATDDTAMLALLSSSPHYWWTVARASSMKTDIRYTPSDVFETLALPELTQEMREFGDRLNIFRRELMLSRQAGLTATYNLVNKKDCQDADIVELREIHRAIDEAVCRAYGWEDLIPQLDHGIHPIIGGRDARWTVGPGVQREIVDRLLELNHERYAAEVAAGLHDKKTAKVGRGKGVAAPETDDQAGLF